MSRDITSGILWLDTLPGNCLNTSHRVHTCTGIILPIRNITSSVHTSNNTRPRCMNASRHSHIIKPRRAYIAILSCDVIHRHHQFVCEPNCVNCLANCDDILRSSHVGMQKPTMYTERYPDGSLALFFNSLDAEQAGKYYCTGTYANSMLMSKSITIVTISK